MKPVAPNVLNQISDEQVTTAIQRLGLLKVQRLQQELIEGLRDADPRGYVMLRSMLKLLLDPESNGRSNG